MAVQTYNLGTVTAYGDAKAGGYTGTLAEWQALMANYAVVGQQAAQSAQTASTKASEASTSAESAQTAKTAAETAQQRAETAAASITVDDTLSIAGKAADAKATGDAINNINNNLVNLVATALVTDSASGAIAHFEDGADSIPMKSLKVNIEPFQSGTGDPSPVNVRPISGWDSVKVTRGGESALKPSTAFTETKNGITFTSDGNGVYHIRGTNASSSAIQSSIFQVPEFVIPLSATHSLYLKNNEANNNVVIHFLNGDTIIDSWTFNPINRVAATYGAMGGATCNGLRIKVNAGQTVNMTFAPMLIAKADNNTYTINLSSAGTVYGGTLDVVSGELVVDKAIVDLGGLSWGYAEPRFYSGSVTDGITPSGTGDLGAVCEKYALYETGALANQPDFSFFVNSSKMSASAKRIVIRDSNYTDAYSLKSSLNGVHLVYMLATPQTIQLTPQQINSLLGINNVWSDAGNVDVEYRADTKLYIDKKLIEMLT